MKGFKVEAHMTRASSLSDKGMSLGFHTKELDSVEKALIMDFHNETGWLLFSPNEVQDSDIPQGVAEKDAKTPSQRLRAVLFVYWKQLGEKEDFEEFYRVKMEQLINHIKNKLEE